MPRRTSSAPTPTMETAMFYALENSYANETSRGFANTYYILAFRTRSGRDRWLRRDAATLATAAITRRDFSHYLDRPKPFTGQAYVVVDWFVDADECADYGLVGGITTGYPHGAYSLNDGYRLRPLDSRLAAKLAA